MLVRGDMLRIGVIIDKRIEAGGRTHVNTTNGYTENEDLSGVDIIVTCLGDNDGEIGQAKITSTLLLIYQAVPHRQ